MVTPALASKLETSVFPPSEGGRGEPLPAFPSIKLKKGGKVVRTNMFSYIMTKVFKKRPKSGSLFRSPKLSQAKRKARYHIRPHTYHNKKKGWTTKYRVIFDKVFRKEIKVLKELYTFLPVFPTNRKEYRVLRGISSLFRTYFRVITWHHPYWAGVAEYLSHLTEYLIVFYRRQRGSIKARRYLIEFGYSLDYDPLSVPLVWF